MSGTLSVALRLTPGFGSDGDQYPASDPPVRSINRMLLAMTRLSDFPSHDNQLQRRLPRLPEVYSARPNSELLDRCVVIVLDFTVLACSSEARVHLGCPIRSAARYPQGAVA